MTEESKNKAVVQYHGEAITVTFNDVKNLICPLASESEVVIFLKTCQSLQLNPFANEIYLIKYGDRDKASMVIAIDAYLKAAENCKDYDGHEAGVILRDNSGKLEFRQGSFVLAEEMEELVGGYAKVYRKDRKFPFYMAVNKAECIKYTRDGRPTQFWTPQNQPSMLRKVALKRAMFEAFPQLFSGTLSTAEFEEIPENTLPPAYQKEDGDTKWKLFWAKQKERGISPDRVHEMLGITSLKEDWLDQDKTLEEAQRVIDDTLLLEPLPSTENEPEPPPQESKPEEDQVIKNFGELYTVCLQEFGLSRQQVWAELNVTSQMDITETPSECYRQIKAARR